MDDLDHRHVKVSLDSFFKGELCVCIPFAATFPSRQGTHGRLLRVVDILCRCGSISHFGHVDKSDTVAESERQMVGAEWDRGG
jgi:hypothetical protein